MVDKKQSNLPLTNQNKDANSSIDQSGTSFSKNSYELFLALKEQGLLSEAITHVKLINSKEFLDLLAREKFSNAKIPRLDSTGKVNNYVDGYLLTEPQFIKCIMAFSKPMQSASVDLLGDKRAIIAQAMQWLQDDNLELTERLAIAEPKAKLLDDREANKANIIGFRECYKRLKGELDKNSQNYKVYLKLEREFRLWLYNHNYIDSKLVATAWAISNDYCRMVRVDDSQDKTKNRTQLKFTEHGYNAIFRRMK